MKAILCRYQGRIQIKQIMTKRQDKVQDGFGWRSETLLLPKAGVAICLVRGGTETRRGRGSEGSGTTEEERSGGLAFLAPPPTPTRLFSPPPSQSPHHHQLGQQAREGKGEPLRAGIQKRANAPAVAARGGGRWPAVAAAAHRPVVVLAEPGHDGTGERSEDSAREGAVVGVGEVVEGQGHELEAPRHVVPHVGVVHPPLGPAAPLAPVHLRARGSPAAARLGRTRAAAAAAAAATLAGLAADKGLPGCPSLSCKEVSQPGRQALVGSQSADAVRGDRHS